MIRSRMKPYLEACSNHITYLNGMEVFPILPRGCQLKFPSCLMLGEIHKGIAFVELSTAN